MKPGVRIPSSAPAAGCRTQVAHLTWWGVFSFAHAPKRASFCGHFPPGGAWSQFTLWTFLKQCARAERVFLRRKPHRSGVGGNSPSGPSFLFCLFSRLCGWGAFGRRKPSGQSPFSSPTPPAVGGFFGPCRTVFKGPGQTQRPGAFFSWAARPTTAPKNGLAPPCAGRRRFAFWQGVCYNDGNLLAGPAAPAPACRGRRGAGPPHSNTALF